MTVYANGYVNIASSSDTYTSKGTGGFQKLYQEIKILIDGSQTNAEASQRKRSESQWQQYWFDLECSITRLTITEN